MPCEVLDTWMSPMAAIRRRRRLEGVCSGIITCGGLALRTPRVMGCTQRQGQNALRLPGPSSFTTVALFSLELLELRLLLSGQH